MTQLFTTFVRSLANKCLPAGKSTRIYEIHSKRNMEARTNTSDKFRKETSGASILISSDVSARGIDYPGVTRIIQVGVPSTADQYVHRVGRTGRGTNSSGRADLVLLPWEAGFVTWQLTDIPLKPLTVTELESQVTRLAAEHDENPNAYYESHGAIRRPSWNSACSSVLTEYGSKIEELTSKLDEDAVSETVISLLGYYMSRSGDLRVQPSVVVSGCKDWSVEACGLPSPPYISPGLLEKIGAIDKSDRRRPFVRSGGDRSQPHWMGRGSQRVKDQRRREDGPPGPAGFGFKKDGEGGGDRGDRPPRDYSKRDFVPRDYSGGDRPPRREYSGDRPPRREYSGDRPRRDFSRGDRSEGEGYSGPRHHDAARYKSFRERDE